MKKIEKRLRVMELVAEIASEAAQNPNIVWMIEFQEQLVERLYRKMIGLIEEDPDKEIEEDEEEEYKDEEGEEEEAAEDETEEEEEEPEAEEGEKDSEEGKEEENKEEDKQLVVK